MVKQVNTQQPLTKQDCEKIREAAKIVDSFSWNSTDEGLGYWSEVHDKLLRISYQKPACESCGQVLPE